MAEFLKEACFGLIESLLQAEVVNGIIGSSVTLSVFWPSRYCRRHYIVCTYQDVVELAPYLEQNFGKLFSSKIVSCANILRLLYKSECQIEPVAISSCVYWRWDL